MGALFPIQIYASLPKVFSVWDAWLWCVEENESGWLAVVKKAGACLKKKVDSLCLWSASKDIEKCFTERCLDVLCFLINFVFGFFF